MIISFDLFLNEENNVDDQLYHGTLHKFLKFETKNIGTGEGNQSFGYGLYFTSIKPIAEFYAKKLSDDIGGYLYVVNVIKKNFIDWYNPIDDDIKNMIIDKLNTMGIYELPIKRLLIDNNIETIYKDIETAVNFYQNGKFLYENLSIIFNSEKIASNFLLSVGIDGIKYTESTLSKKFKNNFNGYNYVIFNEDNITIEDIIEIL